jgi:hypothetical protein
MYTTIVLVCYSTLLHFDFFTYLKMEKLMGFLPKGKSYNKSC